MTEKNKILTDSEIGRLKSMSLYWKEVRNREDQSPLTNEINQLYGMLGIRLLYLVEDHIKLIGEKKIKTRVLIENEIALPLISRARAESAVPLEDCSGRNYDKDEREDII